MKYEKLTYMDHMWENESKLHEKRSRHCDVTSSFPGIPVGPGLGYCLFEVSCVLHPTTLFCGFISLPKIMPVRQIGYAKLSLNCECVCVLQWTGIQCTAITDDELGGKCEKVTCEKYMKYNI